MERYRTIKKYGNSFVIFLHLADLLDLKLKEGDQLDISDCTIKPC
jgi:antitoxin component of MazEF toxin-antitoxin module